MKGTTTNNKGKTEKNKKVKEGECIFPFRYKHKEHLNCYETEFGKICATEINPKTRTLVKYGYCKLAEKSAPKKVHQTTIRKKLILKSTKEKIHNKTMKRKGKLKLVAKKVVSMATHASPAKLAKPASPAKLAKPASPAKLASPAKPATKRLNEEFISIMSELQDIMMRQGEPFRAKAYRSAAETIMMYDCDITDPKQLVYGKKS